MSNRLSRNHFCYFASVIVWVVELSYILSAVRAFESVIIMPHIFKSHVKPVIQSWLSVTSTRDMSRKFITRVQSTVMELKVVTNSRSTASIGFGSSTDVLLGAISRLHEVRSNVKMYDVGFETFPLCCRYRKEVHTTPSLRNQ